MDLDHSYFTGISCSSASFCIALEAGGGILTSTNPTGGSGSWSAATVEESGHVLDEVSCVAESLCVIGNNDGSVITSTDPTGGAAAWTATHLDVGSNSLTGVSCASEALCVGIDDAGNVVTATDPAGGASAWTETNVDRHGLDGVSCPSTSLCVAVDEAGDVLTSTEPAGGSSAWHFANVDGTIPLDGVSCASVSLCVAIDSEGDVVTSTDPTGGAGAWMAAQIAGSGRLRGISCPSEKLCVVTADGAVLTSTNPAGGADAWNSTSFGVGRSISCPSMALCVAVGGDDAATSTNPTGGESAWTRAYLGGEGAFPQINELDEISCAQSGLCVATTYGGNGSPGNVMVSSSSTGGAQAWIENNVYGVPLEPPNPILPLEGVELTGVSCVPGVCAVVDVNGRVMVGTPSMVPVNTALPVLSGTPAVGQTLSCSEGSWSGDPTPTLSYQWLRGGTPIGGANASTYVVQATDQGQELACEVMATNSAGQVSATSNRLQVPAAQVVGGGGSQGTVSNAFVLNGIECMARRGTIKLTLTLPEPGTLQIVGRATVAHLASAAHAKRKRQSKRTLLVARLHLTISKAGRITVMLAPTASAKTILVQQNKLRATVTITYMPEGGKPRSIVRTVTFRLKRRR